MCCEEASKHYRYIYENCICAGCKRAENTGQRIFAAPTVALRTVHCRPPASVSRNAFCIHAPFIILSAYAMFSQWFCISKLGNQATNISFPSSFACVALCMALCVWLFWPQQRRQPEEYENFHKICSLWPFSDNKSFRSFNKEILWPASTLSGVPCVCVCVGRRFAYFEGAKLI